MTVGDAADLLEQRALGEPTSWMPNNLRLETSAVTRSQLPPHPRASSEPATSRRHSETHVAAPDQQMQHFDRRKSAVTAKQELQVPVFVNQVTKMSLRFHLLPLFWQSPQFTHKEMKSMIYFDAVAEQVARPDV